MRTETASVASVAARIRKAAARDLPALLTDARIYLDDACNRLGLVGVVSRVRVHADVTATHCIASVLTDFALYPDVDTARACYAVIAAHHAGVLRGSDSTKERLMREGVRAPEPVAPNLHRAPCGALDWQTQPVIGINPAIWAEGLELAQAIEKRAKRIKGSPKRERAVTSPFRSLQRGRYAMQPAQKAADVPKRGRVAKGVVALAEKWSR